MADSASTSTLSQRALFAPLNFDLLLSIMELIPERRDLFSFMRTCHDLYTSGIPLLLRFPCLLDPRNLRSFHDFLSSNAPSRFKALSNLHVDADSGDGGCEMIIASSTDLETLADMLQKATALEKLSLYGKRLCQNADIPRAIASLTTLRTLKLWSRYGEHTEFILTRLHSPLTSVKLNYHPTQDVFLPLANFRNTLQSASLLGGIYIATDTRWLHVTHLEIAYSRPRLSVLVPALPNITTLMIGEVDVHLGDEASDTLRHENIQFQERHSSSVWKLYSLSTDLEALYALGLQFQVPQLKITDFVPVNHVDLSWLPDAIAPLRPVQLIVWGFAHPTDPKGLAELFRKGAGDLRELYISAVLSDESPDYDVHMETFLNELAPLNEYGPGLSMLSFFIDADKAAWDAEARADEFLDHFDSNAFARRVIGMLPSIKLMRLKKQSDIAISQQYWESCDQGGVEEVGEERLGLMKGYEDFDISLD